MKKISLTLIVLICYFNYANATKLKIKPLGIEDFAYYTAYEHSNWFIAINIKHNDTTEMYSVLREELEFIIRESRQISSSSFDTILYNAIYNDTLHVDKKEYDMIKSSNYFDVITQECINQDMNIEKEILRIFNEHLLLVKNSNNIKCALNRMLRKRYLLAIDHSGIIRITGLVNE